MRNNELALCKCAPDPRVVADGVLAKPLDMWNWGAKSAMPVMREAPDDIANLSLIPLGEATVRADGILFGSLAYIGAYSEREGRQALQASSYIINSRFTARITARLVITRFS
jgi:hypothetical protein